MGSRSLTHTRRDKTGTMSIASSKDVFFDQLKDLKSATEQTVHTFPGLVGWATDEGLRDILSVYFKATELHLQQILLIFSGHSLDAGDDLCKAVAGLIEGGNAHIIKAETPKIRDHLLIAHCTRIGHYLEAAALFTRGISAKCDLRVEEVALAGIAVQHGEFITSLAAVGASAFGLKIAGGR